MSLARRNEGGDEEGNVLNCSEGAGSVFIQQSDVKIFHSLLENPDGQVIIEVEALQAAFHPWWQRQAGCLAALELKCFVPSLLLHEDVGPEGGFLRQDSVGGFADMAERKQVLVAFQEGSDQKQNFWRQVLQA